MQIETELMLKKISLNILYSYIMLNNVVIVLMLEVNRDQVFKLLMFSEANFAFIKKQNNHI